MDLHVGKPVLTADGDVVEVAEYIFLHPHLG